MTPTTLNPTNDDTTPSRPNPAQRPPDARRSIDGDPTPNSRVLGLLWLVPAAVCLGFILVRANIVPFWDDYAIANFLVKTADRGFPAWADLIAQHNESRKFFPRLVYWLLTLTGQWDVRRQMVLHWSLLFVSMFALISLCKATLPASLSLKCSTLASFVLFSLAQWQNLLWGIQVVVVTPTFALICGIWCLWVPRWYVGVRVGLAAILAVISTFSYANGMVVWALLGVAVLFAPDVRIRHRMVATAVFAVIGGLSIWYFFHGWIRAGAYVAVPYTPMQILEFTCAFVGNGLRFTTDVGMAVAVGAFGLFVAGACIAVVAVNCVLRRTFAPLHSAVPWAVLAGYAVLSGAAAAVGRLSYGLEAAIAMRYPTFAIPFWVALLPLVALSLAGTRCFRGPWVRRGTTFVAGMIFCLVLVAQVLALRESSSHVRDRVIANTTLRWIQVAPNDAEIASKIYPGQRLPRETVAGLVRVNLCPVPINTELFAEAYPPPGGEKWSAPSIGSLDSIEWEGNLLRARGWALSPRSSALAADAVLLAVQSPSGGYRLFALAPDVSRPRPDVPRVFGVDHNSKSGWEIVLDPTIELRGGEMITSFAYDVPSNSLTRISSTLRLPVRPNVLPPPPSEKSYVEDYPSLPADLVDLPYSFGSLQFLRWAGNDLAADGWAISSRSPSRPAEAVVLSVSEPTGRNRIIAVVSKVSIPRFDVPERLGPSYTPLVGWEITFSPPKEMPPAGTVTAWIYDSKSASLRKIPSPIPLPQKD